MHAPKLGWQGKESKNLKLMRLPCWSPGVTSGECNKLIPPKCPGKQESNPSSLALNTLQISPETQSGVSINDAKK